MLHHVLATYRYGVSIAALMGAGVVAADVGGAALITGEGSAMGIDFTYHADITKQVKIAGTGAYEGSAYGKLTYTSPSLKLCRQSDGVWRYVNHNNQIQSQTFGTSWAASGIAVTSDTQLAPDGLATTADTLTASSVGTDHRMQGNVTGITLAGVPYTASVWVKKGNHRYVYVDYFSGSGEYTCAVFDLDGGGSTATQTLLIGSVTLTSTSQTSAGGGWFLLKIVSTMPSAGGNWLIGFAGAATGNTSAAFGVLNNFTPAGTETFHVWGGQFKRYPVNDAGGFTATTGYLATTSSAVYDLPFEWDISGNSLGILVEEQRANIVVGSQNLGQASGVASYLGVTKTNDTQTAPDGTTTADTITEDTGNSRHMTYTGSSFAVSNGVTYTASVFVKGGTKRYFALAFSLGASKLCAVFDTQTGTATGSTNGSLTAQVIGAAADTNGWNRFWITGTSGGTAGSIELCLSDSATPTYSNGNPSYTGTSDTMHLWGWQVEAGAFATSPIHTVAASVTRAPDNISLATSAIPFSTTVGTLIAAAQALVLTGVKWMCGMSDNISDTVQLGHINAVTAFDVYDGTQQAALDAGAALTSVVKLAGAWAANDYAKCYNGGTVTTDVSGTAPSTMSQLGIGDYYPGAGERWAGYIHQITYLPRRCTNLELQTRTNDIGASVLLLGEDDGLAFDFTYATTSKQARIKDNTTPANMYNGSAQAKLTYTSPSVKLCRQSDGVYRYNNHNLVPRSQEFNTTWLVDADATVNANATTAPDGTSTADELKEAATTAEHIIYQPFGGGLVANATYEFSVFAKANTRSWMFIRTQDTTQRRSWFNLTSGVTGTTNANHTTRITSVGNGWYKCTVRYTVDQVGNFAICAVASADNTSSYLGDITKSIYIWGFQVKRYPVNEGDGFTPSTGYLATITTAVYDLPYEWSAALASQGILIEEARTNALLRSQEIGTTWGDVAGESTNTANAATAPDGTTTADSYTCANTVSAQHTRYQSVTQASAATTISIFAKWNGSGTFKYMFWGISGDHGSWFNVDSGVAGSTVGTIASKSISAEANGWYRLVVTISAPGANPTPYFAISSSDPGTGDGRGIAVGVVGSGVYAWGAQVELGAFPSSPIHTIAATVTRAVDNITLATSIFPWSDSAGSLVVAGMLPYTPSVNPTAARIIQVDESVGNELHLIYKFPSDSIVYYKVTDGGVTQGEFTPSGSITANTTFKVGSAYSANDLAAVINGGTVATDASATMPTVTKVYLGAGISGANTLNGYIRQVTYLKRRAPNTGAGSIQEKTT